MLYLSLEDTFNRLQKRLLQLVGSEEAPERLVMQTECGSIGQGLEEQLTSFLYQHPDTGLIVIDTLQKVRSSDQNNSMYASDYKEISALKALADKYNVCILLIHHLRKQAADDPFQQIAGSNGLMGASDTSWVMQRKRMSQTASILVTGRDMDNKTLRLHEENCVWMLDEEESTEQIVAKAVPSYLWKVADYIDSVGTWQTMRGKICGLYRNALVKQTAWWRSTPTKASAKVRSPQSSATKLAWHWPARSGASVSKCWSLPI